MAAVSILSSGMARAAQPCSGVEIGGTCYQFTSITLPGFEGEILGANKHGELVGSNSPVNTFIHPEQGFEILGDGTVNVIVDPAGPNLTELIKINDHGDMAGWIYDGNYLHGFTRSAAGVFTPYDFFTPTVRNTGTQVNCLNNFGDLVGRTDGMLPSDVAFLKTSNGVQAFTYLGGTTFAVGVNNHDDVVGFATVAGVNRGYVRAPDGTMTAIDFSGSINTEPIAINDHGVIVGDWTDVSHNIHGFIYDPSSQQYSSFDIPGAGVRETNVTVITNQGEVYGNYFIGTTPIGYLLSPKH